MDEKMLQTTPDVEARSNGDRSTYPSVAALANDIGLSERTTREALRRGEIPHIRIGRRFILPKAAIAEWLRTAGQNSEIENTQSRLKLVALTSTQR
jgi:excisionase family DNA binding protein